MPRLSGAPGDGVCVRAVRCVGSATDAVRNDHPPFAIVAVAVDVSSDRRRDAGYLLDGGTRMVQPSSGPAQTPANIPLLKATCSTGPAS
jgi:hypothetical protein